MPYKPSYDSEAQREEAVRRYREVDTAVIADVLDDLGKHNQGLSPSFTTRTSDRIVGWAYTIGGSMTPRETTGDALKMEACSGIGSHQVAVWGGNGEGVCYFGELIGLGMLERGATGALVDGGVRDLNALEAAEFPVFARYASSVQSIGRWYVTHWQEPLYVSGATARYVEINPNDFIVGDRDGVIVVPNELVDGVLDAAEDLMRTESQIRASLANGMTLSEALDQFGHV